MQKLIEQVSPFLNVYNTLKFPWDCKEFVEEHGELYAREFDEHICIKAENEYVTVFFFKNVFVNTFSYAGFYRDKEYSDLALKTIAQIERIIENVNNTAIANQRTDL